MKLFFMELGTNSVAERLFSLVKRIWSSEKSQLQLSKVKSLALIKFNTNDTCIEFYKKISKETEVLRAVQSGDKYKGKINLFTMKPNVDSDDEEEDAICSVVDEIL